jgi:RNA polymerase sporulation-specific sigma factor
MKNYKDLSINDLVMLAREHDEDAFCELVSRFTPMISRVIGSFSSAGVTEDELFSEGCVALHSAVNSYNLSQEKVTFGLYARVCVYNAVVDCVRKSAGAPTLVSSSELSDIDDGSSLENAVANKDTLEFLIKSAKKILSYYEYTVLMYHIRGYRTSAIAKKLSRPPRSIDNAKSRIFKRLRDAFGDISDF